MPPLSIRIDLPSWLAGLPKPMRTAPSFDQAGEATGHLLTRSDVEIGARSGGTLRLSASPFHDGDLAVGEPTRDAPLRAPGQLRMDEGRGGQGGEGEPEMPLETRRRRIAGIGGSRAPDGGAGQINP